MINIDSFSTVFNQYKPLVFSVAYNYCKNVDDANDITQDTFIKYLKHDTVFESEEHRKAWLIRVTINNCKSLLVSSWFQKTVPLDEKLPFVDKEESELTFPTNENIIDINDATAFWHRFDNDYIYEYECDIEPGEIWPMVEDDYRLINFTDKKEFGKRLFKTVEDPSVYTEGEVKLFVDGVEIKRTVTTGYRWASAMDSTENPTAWGNVIIYEAFDVSTAETIEVRYKDQTIKVK